MGKPASPWHDALERWIDEHSEWSQRKLARELDLGTATVSRIIRERRDPEVNIALRIQDLTGISVELLRHGAPLAPAAR